MASIDSPAAARRRIRLAVRKAREVKHLTQGDVAEHLEWSISKVNRIENGDVTVSLTDLRALMALLDITDVAKIDELSRDAKAARKRGWWDDPRYRAHLTPSTLQLIQYEVEATAIRTFQPTLIPGVMQTAEYASTVLDFWSADLSLDAREVRQEVRARRGRHLFDQASNVTYLAMFDESVVMRAVGGQRVLAEQLQAVLDVLSSTSLIVRIVPLADSANVASLGGFTIFDFAAGENEILYREAALVDELTEDVETIARYRSVFEHAWDLALTPEASRRLLRARLAGALAQLDRSQQQT